MTNLKKNHTRRDVYVFHCLVAPEILNMCTRGACEVRERKVLSICLKIEKTDNIVFFRFVFSTRFDIGQEFLHLAEHDSKETRLRSVTVRV